MYTKSQNPQVFKDFDILKRRPIYFNQKTGYYIALAEEGTLVVQSIVMPVQGRVTALGEWIEDKKYGRQFKSSKVFFKDPQAAIEIIIGSGFLNGIKESKAAELVNTLGQHIFEVLDASVDGTDVKWRGSVVPGKFVLRTVKGIGPIVIEQVVDSWRERRGDIRYAITAVQAGLSMRQYRVAMDEIGGETLQDWILNSPYKLSTLSFFDWTTVDALAHVEWEGKVAIPHNSPMRLAAAVREVITRYSGQGHMAMPFPLAINHATALAQPTVNFWNTIAEHLDEEGLIVFNSQDADMITTKKLFEIEKKAAEKLVLLINAKPRFDQPPMNISPADFSKFELSQEQLDGVDMAIHNNISVLTGGPGCGKTFCTNIILNILDKYGISYTLCAPTGKAARRMKEATGRDAATLHREFHIGGDTINLTTNYLILDEVSMVSAEMMKQVLELVNPGQRIVFVGDSDQLPPVGPGEPLMQMLSTFIPQTKLKVIYRQAENSGIITAAHQINTGIVPQSSPNGDFIIDQVSEQSLFQKVNESVKHFESLGIPKDDILVLTPLNKGPLGRFLLNKTIQDFDNPVVNAPQQQSLMDMWSAANTGVQIEEETRSERGMAIPGTFFRIGDKVIQTKNNYEMGDEGIMNGQVGTIVGANLGAGSDMFSKEDSFMVVDFEGELVDVTDSQAALLDLAYVLTIHKTQGSQFHAIVCVVPLTREDFMLRQLIYTGVTRAAKYCKLLVQGDALHRYVKNESKLRRFSMLAGLIEAFQKEIR